MIKSVGSGGSLPVLLPTNSVVILCTRSLSRPIRETGVNKRTTLREVRMEVLSPAFGTRQVLNKGELLLLC